jgi:predicted dehydrogenase
MTDAPARADDDLNVALIGAGNHGRDLLNYCLDLPGVRFRAVADIWPYARTYAGRLLRRRGHDVRDYADHREMLAAGKDLQAAIIATPDAFHADQAVDCLKAGLHVYLEKEMHHTLEGCRRVVLAARETGRLVQVGRQHRSNPRYLAALDYVDREKALGRITGVWGQWHGHRRHRIPWPEKYALDAATLSKYGYASMEEFRNWRWSRRFSAGEAVNLGAHQIDVFNWFLHAPPRAVYAAGGRDYYDFFDWYDNVSCLFEWDYAWQGVTKTVRGAYRISTTDEGGFWETFFGDEGALTISEIATRGYLIREPTAAEAPWEKGLERTLIRIGPTPLVADLRARMYPPIPWPGVERPVHWYHLKNFFDAVRGRCKLTCPPEVGYEAAASAFAVNRAMLTDGRLALARDEFKV